VCFIFYHHLLVIHRSCLDTHLYSGSLKISSLPPQLESGCLPIWPLDVPSPFPFTGPILTPSFTILISFVLCLFTSFHTPLSIITFKTLVIFMPLSSCLIWTYLLKHPLLHPSLRNNGSPTSPVVAYPSLTPYKSCLNTSFVVCLSIITLTLVIPWSLPWCLPTFLKPPLPFHSKSDVLPISLLSVPFSSVALQVLAFARYHPYLPNI
jgi:hypothetical protein